MAAGLVANDLAISTVSKELRYEAEAVVTGDTEDAFSWLKGVLDG